MKLKLKKVLVLKLVFFALAGVYLAIATGCSDSVDPTREVEPTIVDIAVASDDFNTLVAAVGAAGLVDTLNGPGEFTVFAPTDAAFDALPPGTVDTLLDPANIGLLQDILTYHVLSGGFDASRIVAQDAWTTLLGLDITVDVNGTVVLNAGTDNPATIVQTDIFARNGVIHVIDAVLIPEDD